MIGHGNMAGGRSKRLGATLFAALVACSVVSPATAQNENASAVKAKQPYEIRVFHLRYAKVSDLRITEDGHEIVKPGVASMLQGIMGVRGDAKADVKGPRIEADDKNNAVIVRDRPEAMPVYEALVSAADVESSQAPTRPLFIAPPKASARAPDVIAPPKILYKAPDIIAEPPGFGSKAAAKYTYEVRVYYLKYARVADQRITKDGHEVVAVGVATMLRGIMGDGSPDSAKDSKGPRIVADEKNNAVIIRDHSVSMPTYDALIAAFDVPTHRSSLQIMGSSDGPKVRPVEAVSQ